MLVGVRKETGNPVLDLLSVTEKVEGGKYYYDEVNKFTEYGEYQGE